MQLIRDGRVQKIRVPIHAVRESASRRARESGPAVVADCLAQDNNRCMTTTTLNQLFDSLGECLTVDTASKLTNLSIPQSLQTQLDDWAERNSLGQLTGDERNQYEAILRALNFVSVLQAKARGIVANAQP